MRADAFGCKLQAQKITRKKSQDGGGAWTMIWMSEMKLVVHDAEHRAEADPGLLRLIARAHDFQERLIQDPDLTVPAIASQERLTIGYLSRLLRLPSLAPDIFTAMINGQHPPQLSAKRLMRLALKLPTD
jgi:hypothetical protein